MRLVVDTNIFVSILIKPGQSFLALVDYIDRTATLLYSTDMLTELVDILSRSKLIKYAAQADVADLVKWFIANGELIAVEHDVTGSRDLSDNKFLSVALAGKTDCLISGDKDLLILGRIEDIPIQSPADFIRAVGH